MYISARTMTCGLAIAAVVALTGTQSSAQPFAIPWWTVDGGGATFSAGEAFTLGGTIGQPDATVMSGGTYTLSGGFWAAMSAGGCAPELLWAHSVATHKTGPGATAEFFVNLDISGNPAMRTSEPRDSGIRVLEFQFDRNVESASIAVTGPGGAAGGGALTLLPGSNGPTSKGRIDLGAGLSNGAVYSIEVAASSGPGCDLSHGICVAALIGDFNDNDTVSASDKGELLGFMFQPVTQTNARYDLQVSGVSNSGIINVADLGAWTGFFGTSVVGTSCP